jgi:hypothetical protein
MLFAYIGPETILPIASFIAGAVGVILMAGQRIRRWIVRACRLGGGCSGPEREEAPRA